jgi:methionyl-tRNA synthetase
MSNRHYVTTAIDYPNAAPHMGHVLEKVLADVVVRWLRASGHEVRFQIGTDEHGIKIQQTAQKQGMTPAELVEKNVPFFVDLYSRLGISYDVFIRTTDQKKHWPTVEALWRKLRDAGVLEKRTYTGLYCSGCERFVTKKDLIDGKCDIHQVPPQEVSEENWFFVLSKETQWLKDLLKKEYKIIPEFRAPETFSLLDQGLEDVSFSRPVSSLSWGIPVPDEEGQTMYVWCDALTNYISGLGYFTDHEEREFWDDATVTHVIGKDIARFHALIWPAMLKHAGVKMPDQLLIHGFLTSEGQKMSKSLGNVVVPDDVIGKYGVDALRFYLSHEIIVGNDGDFSWEQFANVYNGILRNQLGNLLNRVLVMLKKEGGNVQVGEWETASKDNAGLWSEYDASMQNWELRGIDKAMKLVQEGNLKMEQKKPWTLPAEEKLVVLGGIAEMLRHTALMLLPYIPETARKMSSQLGVPYADQMLEKSFVITPEMKKWGGLKDWAQIGEPRILFPQIEE